MLNIIKQRIADCDRSSDEKGNFTSSAWEYAVWGKNEMLMVFDTEDEADAWVAENAEYVENHED